VLEVNVKAAHTLIEQVLREHKTLLQRLQNLEKEANDAETHV
jgi:hypothetical protein